MNKLRFAAAALLLAGSPARAQGDLESKTVTCPQSKREKPPGRAGRRQAGLSRRHGCNIAILPHLLYGEEWDVVAHGTAEEVQRARNILSVGESTFNSAVSY